MQAEIARFEAQYERLSQHKRLCTGEPLKPLHWEQLPETIDTLEAFKALVSLILVQWNEEWGGDVGFLRVTERSATSKAQSFGRTLTRIRTAYQHSPTEEDLQLLANWQYEACGTRSPKEHEEWTTCAKELVVQLTDAVSELADAAATVLQREDKRQAWHERASESVRSAVVRVADDLGLRLPESSISYHERQVEGRWRNYQIARGRDARSELDSLAERSLMVQSPRLPCHHLEILRQLQVIGSPLAFAGIQLAHGVAAVSRTRGEAFLQLVVKTWASVQPTELSTGASSMRRQPGATES
ncbi:hypothetical protein [Amycolatopsis sp. SID8362]|uniref:hypothetical protein n=1 Tax=Amycolatopsis sp. SID8362 TaxID=2690346 RepID=UPI00136AC3DE|nr:hypothetical protein [Amycolatopsis sp. SID8362]NBH08299.1 hypothetical protein [Amycolatopsis sp. SID8362]NED44994.1 hypothetical protein [Amycolatopsis sp. SID8362]